jgi:hypothetical protein
LKLTSKALRLLLMGNSSMDGFSTYRGVRGK